ncbi:hypothetical protein LKL22_14625 [Bacillus licheniformis]|uniref:hypothetical protein n=1 Tax=Bacillus TaxID=1386 RepID=UPI001D0EECD1|nr:MULTISPECIES: hypothetical protein [Bacillus]MCC2134073.1 hypothetical protein [Bacillus licheniformis]MCC2146409.1 hypothetical protein [Bacillus licheniformis]MCC2161962.1 hypothetical protein [Bacillus licheniformis]MCC2187093.1 hypothetical protein [Bacillus licheniformis]MCX2881361.1 hypothetical protein [Bacillus sp. AR11]
MTKTKKYVRIKKAKKPSHWYADKVGQVFELEREANLYTTRRGDGRLTAIRKEDAELIVTEKRPAEVGERVLITEKPVRKDYEIYEPVTVDNVNIYGVESYKNGRPIFLNHYEYEVIINNEVKNEEADGMKIDLNAMGYDKLIAHGEAVLTEIQLRSYNEGYKQGKFDAEMDTTYMPPQENSAQERRDKIVEQAKADVERLRMINRMLQTFDITFDINRESRTVEAVAKKPNSRTAFYGTAICAPDDCFNVHIGEAIALHRALGLEVPDEYLNAPQPTEVRVGDVIAYRGLSKTTEYAIVVADEESTGSGRVALSSIAATKSLVRVTDDSRTEVVE